MFPILVLIALCDPELQNLSVSYDAGWGVRDIQPHYFDISMRSCEIVRKCQLKGSMITAGAMQSMCCMVD
jgi:hypothetical protein